MKNQDEGSKNQPKKEKNVLQINFVGHLRSHNSDIQPYYIQTEEGRELGELKDHLNLTLMLQAFYGFRAAEVFNARQKI